MDTGFF